ncbi:MAG: hypothetical protein DMG58_12150 [Acidobacteria bacterium]|nr:MAG: hypothetical protein DMG58_12150 [Acidobacteriota bacterium]
MDPEQLFIGRALDRIKFLIVFLSGAGALVTAVYGGWRWALGYVLGAAAGYLNFRWLKKLVDSLGEAAGGKPPRARMAVFRAGGYVILNFSALSMAAAAVGLFVPVAAVILEILFELIYAGT